MQKRAATLTEQPPPSAVMCLQSYAKDLGPWVYPLNINDLFSLGYHLKDDTSNFL